jgi:ferrous iron transport protein B
MAVMVADAGLAPRVALVGVPNSGKTSVFNALTGSRQKVGNYAGVTVERKEGSIRTPGGRTVSVLDLPGTYSLRARSPDEEVTRDAVLGKLKGETPPDLLVCVADATNLRLVLRLMVELRRTGRPMVLALNMMDIARRRGLDIDMGKLAQLLGVPVVSTVAVRKGGIDDLVASIDGALERSAPAASTWAEPSAEDLRAYTREAEAILAAVVHRAARPDTASEMVDRVVLHPVFGVVILLALMALVFQAVFTWAGPLMELTEAGFGALGTVIGDALPDGALRSLLVDGVIAGVGGVVVFLPQIVILFFFINLLEDTGYMARAAFLMDRIMGGVGLHGRAFIPLLSSFACAVPGIMAARVIENPRDRLTTILVAPLMTCSARLPVYVLLIGAFVPDRAVGGVLNLRGLAMFALYAAGLLFALLVAFILKRTALKGEVEPLMMELPSYMIPDPRNLLINLWSRAAIFMRRAGVIILPLMVVVWFISTYPGAPEGMEDQAVAHSYAGMIGQFLEPLVAPIGFDWRIAVGLVIGLAAREVMVGVLGTIFAVGAGEAAENALSGVLASTYGLPTAIALLAWYVFAPQCIATLGVVKRETNSWRWTFFCFAYLMALAWTMAYLGNHVTAALMGG